MTVGVFGDDHDVGDRLPPGQLIGVMLIGADEHHRPFRFRDARRQLVPLIQPGRDAQLQEADQLADRRSRPRSAEDDQIILGPADSVLDHPPRVLPQPARRQASPRTLGVRVRVPRKHRVADEILDEVQRPPGRRVVGIGQPTGPERPAISSPSPMTPRRTRSSSGDVGSPGATAETPGPALAALMPAPIAQVRAAKSGAVPPVVSSSGSSCFAPRVPCSESCYVPYDGEPW